ncbi:hypothetical protein KDA23_02605 [Candidatus Saccharibacteria bacterium]|nr:hypothetical protein [Candidatus Saccharibacteria bacterium]
MATRVKTVQYAFPTYTSVVTNATVTNLTQITLYIPETVTAFRSVTVDVGFQDVITATGGTITEQRVGLRLGAVAYSTTAITDSITNSGEEMSIVDGPWDFTSYFTTNWSGTSKTCDLQVYFNQSTGTTLGMRNVTAIITVTYEYDDTAATQVKTAWIPLESLVGPLTTTANSNIGTSQIPQLTGAGGMLPENSVTIRDYYFVIEGNENTAATTDFTLTVNIDSGTSFAFGTQEAALNSQRYCRWIYKPTTPSLGATHNFQMWSSLATRFHHTTITLVVTYQFTLSGTSTVLNSIQLPMELTGPLGATTTADASRMSRDIFINEPGTISMQQSGFRMNWNSAATPTGLRLRAGSQAYRVYTPQSGTVAGMFGLQQRIDSGSAQGAALTLARGKNTITVDGYITVTTNQITNVSGYIILNYHSGLSPSGIGAHSHTIYYLLLAWAALLSDRTRIDNYSITLPESNYYFVGIGYIFYQIVQTASMGITFDTQCLSGEAKGGGYYDIYADAYQADNERSCSIVWMRGRDVFLRYPGDPGSDRVDIQTARNYRLFTSTTTSNGLMLTTTYNSITYTVSGNITGSNGGSVTINIFRSDTNELVYTTSRTGNGSYSFQWHDDTVALYASAYEDSNHRGRSIEATAGTSLDVMLSRPIVRSYA